MYVDVLRSSIVNVVLKRLGCDDGSNGVVAVVVVVVAATFIF